MKPDTPPPATTMPASRKTGRIWRLLLLMPFLALLWPRIYSRMTPELWGFPFFYWYQFVCMAATAVITWLVYTRNR